MQEAVASALAELARQDEFAAKIAENTLCALAPDRGLEGLHQHAVQRFCWYELPIRFQGDPREQLFAVRSLGHLFTLLGLHRYSQICAAEETAELLRTYAEDHAAGTAAYERLMWESGVEPPDLDELTWGTAVGDAELAAREAAAAALELAVALGDVRPGKRGWRVAQERFTRSFLTQPDAEGRSHLDRIREERVREWLGSPAHPHRQRLWPLVGQIIAGTETPRDAAVSLAPLQRLLDEAADGIPLTQIGYISPSVVRGLCTEFGWSTSPAPPRSETDAMQLITLHQMLRGMRAVRRSGRRLVLTRRGRQLREDTDALWRAVTETVCRTNGFEQAATETMLGLLLSRSPQGAGSHAQRGEPDIEMARRVLAEAGWGPTGTRPGTGDGTNDEDGARADAERIRSVLITVTWLLETLGFLRGDAESRELTGTGRSFALTALHLSATAPRTVL